MSPAHSPGAAREVGPSPLLPVAVSAAGTALLVLELARVIRFVPVEGQARPMSALVLAAALALGGFSLSRVLQLLALVSARARRRAAGAERPVAPFALTEAHSLHAVWVIAVGASVALMGLLGLWSLADGRPSGLEPGWPLVLVGAATALVAHLARERITRCWAAEEAAAHERRA